MNTRTRPERDCGLDLLIGHIFLKCWGVWQQYEGYVPESEFVRLDRDMDAPAGTTATAMTRIGPRCKSA